MSEAAKNMIGSYGSWAGELAADPPRLSLRTGKYDDVDEWRAMARRRAQELLAEPDTGGTPEAEVRAEYVYDGLQVQELSWQLPYGPPTEAIFLKPEGAGGAGGAAEPLPGIVALHDHGGLKYFGKRKITRTSDELHPIIRKHQDGCYGGVSWANEIARRGYAVLVPDAFPFASRRVLAADVADVVCPDTPDVSDAETVDEINAYNAFAAAHEHVMAKSLFYAGTTWPGVFLAEDRRALDYLCSRPDVDESRVGCGGLSGGGMRTIFLGGMDDRIRCAVCVGLMSTHRDYVLNKCSTHTWMMCVPGMANELDWPEILGLRVPLATMVMNDREDGLFTLPEMERADKILAEVYRVAGSPESYRCSFYPGPHKFDLQMQADAFDWFDRWLEK